MIDIRTIISFAALVISAFSLLWNIYAHVKRKSKIVAECEVLNEQNEEDLWLRITVKNKGERPRQLSYLIYEYQTGHTEKQPLPEGRQIVPGEGNLQITIDPVNLALNSDEDDLAFRILIEDALGNTHKIRNVEECINAINRSS